MLNLADVFAGNTTLATAVSGDQAGTVGSYIFFELSPTPNPDGTKTATLFVDTTGGEHADAVALATLTVPGSTATATALLEQLLQNNQIIT